MHMGPFSWQHVPAHTGTSLVQRWASWITALGAFPLTAQCGWVGKALDVGYLPGSSTRLLGDLGKLLHVTVPQFPSM